VDQADPVSRLSTQVGLRLGIMGGAFDPIHIAHLVTAQEAWVQFRLDEVMFLPSGHPPHKKRQLAPAEFRYLMTAMATASNPNFSVTRLEIERPGVGYTVDTLQYLTSLLAPDARLFFITGADAVLDILTWKDPAGVLQQCTLIAATRPGFDLSRLSAVLASLGPHVVGPGPDARVQIMEVPGLDISSSMIRQRLAAGLPVRYLVPDVVCELIDKSDEYRSPGPS
jgi:nicotinate-nucleotide adenylyltransferase